MNTDARFDVVIVGAGPAGCMAAINLQAGFKVLLIDRLALPRNKSCAGILRPSAVRLLESYNPPEDIYAHPQTIGVTFFDWEIRRQYTLPYIYTNIDRNKFDGWLLGSAGQKPNVEVWEKTLFISVDDISDEPILTLRKDKSTIKVEAGIVIAADGANSRVRKSIGRTDQSFYFTLQEWIKPTGGHRITDFYGFIDERTCLYDWMVPKGDLIVVGGIYDKRENPVERLNHTKQRIGTELGIEGEVVEGPKGYPIIRLGSMDEIFLGAGKVLLSGEAAGFIDASICEGISYALRSGILCAQAINTSPDNPLKIYKKLTGAVRALAFLDLVKYTSFKPRWIRPLYYTFIPQIKTVRRLD
ncbi:MAG: FAD-dependent monooxygenase [Actinobacteria bacterium]|nr:FAD-dependent monooxygenase [Actinomycetota bacterium]